MARFLRYNFFAIFGLLILTSVFVNSLPTSVLVDEKQHQTDQSSSSALNKENHASLVKNSPSSFEHENPIMSSKPQSKLHAQKRGVKQNLYEPGLPNDFMYGNGIPIGTWDDLDENNPYTEFQDLEDYPQYYQPPFSSPHHQRPYENLQHLIGPDNLYDEPLALPSKHKYPTRFFDERRLSKRGVNKNIMRLKRDSTKLNTADMLALLSFLEANQRNRYDNANDDINSLEYQKPSYGPYSNFDVENNDDGGIANDGEWWNEYIEPSVQYYGNSRGYFNDDPRKHLTSTVYPVKRFMLAKKKRSLNSHRGTDDAVAKDVHKKSTFGIDFNRRAA